MPRFLIDANLPYRFSLWHGEDYLHVYDLGDDMPDAAVWQYAKEHDLIIVSKDADFSDWIILSDPPPKVIPAYRQHAHARLIRIHTARLASNRRTQCPAQTRHRA